MGEFRVAGLGVLFGVWGLGFRVSGLGDKDLSLTKASRREAAVNTTWN